MGVVSTPGPGSDERLVEKPCASASSPISFSFCWAFWSCRCWPTSVAGAPSCSCLAWRLPCLCCSVIHRPFAVIAAAPLVSLPLGIGLIPCRQLHLPDLSYGLYLFHMPLVNILLVFGLSGSVSLMIPYIGGSFALAAVSWMFVEKPVLAYKPSLRPVSTLTCTD